MQTLFFFVWQVKGAAEGNERAKADVLISLLAHPLLPFLQESFTSFAESPSALRDVNPFSGSTQSLFSAGHWMLQPAQVKEKLVAANMEEVVFLTIFFSATQR